jgi:RNA polymerase sigma-70 factor (ECF subfamily)
VSQLDLETVYDEHADAVFRFAYRMTGAVAPAEDIVQDCFVELARGRAAHDPARGSMRVFLLGVARRIVQRRWRTESRFDPISEDERAVEPLDLEGLELAEAVAASVQSLPPLQREALILAEYEGFKLHEIAEAVEAVVGAVKARLHRARENLRKTLAPLAQAHGVKTK